ncbi:MAG: diguanylate cyclase [Deltaproteobacteria bacterium]|nr:diguanylate cyclase [Deltaproteobacteria bacterium]
MATRETGKGLKAIATQECTGLLRALAFGGEPRQGLNVVLAGNFDLIDFQLLAWEVGGQSIEGGVARRVVETLLRHREEVSAKVSRPVSIQTAALDLAELLQASFDVKTESTRLSYAELESLAFRDPLTRLHNLRYFEKRFDEEVQRARRYRRSLSLLMLDIDHFKRFNDTHGHPAGNRALVQVAQMLVNESRETDLVIRYGGEEFAFILPETTKRMALELGERVRRKIETAMIALDNGEFHRVTASLGIATFPRDSSSREQLIEAADTALYQCKKQGRNRVLAYVPGTRANFHYRSEKVANSVAVVGDFNDWDKLADPMSLRDGLWSTHVPVAPGTYEYKFVIDGEKWVKDPSCVETVSDGYWGENSIATVTQTPRTSASV